MCKFGQNPKLGAFPLLVLVTVFKCKISCHFHLFLINSFCIKLHSTLPGTKNPLSQSWDSTSFLCWDRGTGDVPPTLDAALLCSSKAGIWIGWGAFNIVSGTTATWCPTIWVVTSHFWLWAIDILVLSGIQNWVLQWLQSVERLYVALDR